MFEVEGFSRRHFIPLLLILVIGFSLGWLGFMLCGNFAGNVEIKYISKAEVLKYERERIKKEQEALIKSIKGTKLDKDLDQKAEQPDCDNIRMFYGRSNEAVKLIEAAALMRSGKNVLVIFVSDEFVRGDNVTSISYEIYSEVMEYLRQQPVEKEGL